MRLTLRTMLAYLDGILEPEDAQDIGKKIEESTFASDLIHRIKGLLHRPGVNAPDSGSQGPSLGPNAVAEYLDNTLPPEKVTEFEKICLDSDIYLAEVSACHQILTLVLGEPAEIDPASRQRMYDLNVQSSRLPADEIPISADSQAEIVLPPPLPTFSAASTDAEIERKSRLKPTVPEYLREPAKRYRWVSFATAGVLAVCLLIVLFKALGFFEQGSVVGDALIYLGLARDELQAAAEAKKSAPKAPETPSDMVAKKKSESKPTAPESKSVSESAEKEAAAPTEAAEPAKSLKIPPTATGTETETTAQAPPSPKTDVDRALDTAPKEPAQTPKQPSSDKLADNAAIPSGLKPPEEKKTPPISERLGHYASEDQVLLGIADPSADWQRVTGKDILTANERLLALPTYRPEITLGASIKLRMTGGTELELLPPADAREPPGIKIRFGRFVAMPLANAGARLRIIIGERTGTITFVDPDAVVAAEVRNIHAPGVNPESETPRTTADFMVSAGHVRWDEAGQKNLEITAPAQFKIADQSRLDLTQLKNIPDWISTETMSQWDQRASPVLIQELQTAQTDRPVGLSLKELVVHRRKEVGWLAMRCLGYLDYFDPIVNQLNDVEHKTDWDNYIEQLREAVGRDAETAAAVRKALESRYQQEAADLYRMLWGYSDKNLESGEDEKLVEYLGSDTLAVRVLSFWNLKEITGKTLLYQPEQTSAKRQSSIQAWKKRSKDKEIRIKSTEEKGANAARVKTAADAP
jgi:hypothetical protein